MLRKVVFCIFIASLISSGAKSQIIDSACYYVSDFLHHTGNFVTSPLHYGDEEICDLAKVISITGLSFIVDKEVHNYSQDGKHRSDFLSHLAKIDNYYGDTKYTIILLGGTLLTGVVTSSKEIFNAGFMLSESVLFSNIITQSLKRVIGRERPDFTSNNLHLIGPNLSLDQYQSLPSGHATTAFALSTVAAGLTKNTYLKILCYTPAFLTSLARIYNNRHWLSDVVLAGSIGYYTGKKVLEMNGKSDENESLKINVGFNSVGIIFQF